MLRAAVAMADEGGIGSVTMRRLAEALGAEAMSLYYHVANKEEVLDGMVDVIATEINEAVRRIDCRPTEPTGSRRCGSGSSPPARSSCATPGRPRSSRHATKTSPACCATSTA